MVIDSRCYADYQHVWRKSLAGALCGDFGLTAYEYSLTTNLVTHATLPSLIITDPEEYTRNHVGCVSCYVLIATRFYNGRPPRRPCGHVRDPGLYGVCAL